MEITVKDLMIGDWVCFDGDENHECPVRIDAINTEDAGVEGDYFDVWEPIPITPEILKKNGFYNSYLVDDYSIAKGVHYNIDSKQILFGFEYGTALEIKCGYVHELQHILKLCKIEKEIVL